MPLRGLWRKTLFIYQDRPRPALPSRSAFCPFSCPCTAPFLTLPLTPLSSPAPLTSVLSPSLLALPVGPHFSLFALPVAFTSAVLSLFPSLLALPVAFTSVLPLSQSFFALPVHPDRVLVSIWILLLVQSIPSDKLQHGSSVAGVDVDFLPHQWEKIGPTSVLILNHLYCIKGFPSRVECRVAWSAESRGVLAILSSVHCACDLLESGTMQLNGEGGGAPTVSNDGSDFHYRMLIDDRYKKAAEGRKLLGKLTAVQGLYALICGCLTAALLARPASEPQANEATDSPWWQTYTDAGAHIQNLTLMEAVPLIVLLVTAFASLIGTIAVQGNKPEPLRVQALLSGVAACLSVWPLLGGTALTAILLEYGAASISGDIKWLIVVAVQTVQDIIGIICNIGVAIVANSLASTMDSRKKQK